MLSNWIDRISAVIQGDDALDSQEAVDNLERVSALLLVEVARADHRIDAREKESIRGALAQAFKLPAQEIDEIVDTALGEADSTVSLHEHLRVVNDHFDRSAKIRLLEYMWQVALADGDIDKYEDYTVRKISELLYLKHRDFMQAKRRVLDGAQG